METPVAWFGDLEGQGWGRPLGSLGEANHPTGLLRMKKAKRTHYSYSCIHVHLCYTCYTNGSVSKYFVNLRSTSLRPEVPANTKLACLLYVDVYMYCIYL